MMDINVSEPNMVCKDKVYVCYIYHLILFINTDK